MTTKFDHQIRSFDGREVEALFASPAALQAAIDYHDLQITMGEPMGYNCEWHRRRMEFLKEVKIKAEEELQRREETGD